MATLRLFLSHGEVLDRPRAFGDLFTYETRFLDSEGLKIPSKWFLDDVLPFLGSYNHDRQWWKDLLFQVIHSPGDMHPSLVQILRCCDVATARSALIRWIPMLKYRRSSDDLCATQAQFEALVKFAQGISILGCDLGKTLSPVSAAVKCRQSWSWFCILVDNSPWKLADIITSELQLRDNGWTEETLLSMFQYDIDMGGSSSVLWGQSLLLLFFKKASHSMAILGHLGRELGRGRLGLYACYRLRVYNWDLPLICLGQIFTIYYY